MTENRPWSKTVLPRGFLRSCVVLAGCAGALLSGCSARKRPAIPWAAAIQVRPTTQPRLAAGSDISEDQVPDVRLEFPPFPLRLLTVRNAPPRPRGVTPSSGAAGNEAEKIEAPLITLQLTAEETAAAQQQTHQSLNIAEKNIEGARGKRLNSAELDLLSKIRGFIKDAREAAQGADWTRARSLSKKAQVLSEELLASK
jgi:hypothetical protein